MGSAGADVLRQFEGVRGVRRVRVKGSVPGFEGYVGWLRRRMMMMRVTGSVGEGGGAGDEAEEEEEYVPVDEAERRRLSGWV
jgi:hypothetical protein